MLQFQNVTKIYDGRIVAVSDLTFNIDSGEFVFLIGPSGGGKTTIIKMLIRDETPSSGKIYFNDKDITKISRRKVYMLRREIGVVFQDFKLIPDKTAYENVAFAMEAAGKTQKEIEETVPYVLDIVGLSNRMTSFPRQLSGGEQQRVAIARAISNNPKVLIADEPTGNLDPASAWDIVQILTKINNWGTTVIMSTHGTDIVNSLNKRVIQMEGGKIMRDDNKGMYEFYSGFEEKVISNTNKEKKKKTGFKTKIKAQESEEDDTITDVLQNQHHKNSPAQKQKPSFFQNIFGKFQKVRPAHNATPARNAVSTAGWHSEAGGSTNSEVRIEESSNSKVPSNSQEKEQQVEEVKIKEEEIKIENRKSEIENRSEVHLSLDLAGPIADTKRNQSEALTTKEEDLGIKLDGKTPISEMKLDQQVLNDLKSSGYKYVEEIVESGVEGLSQKISIDPIEVVQISKELKRILDTNK